MLKDGTYDVRNGTGDVVFLKEGRAVRVVRCMAQSAEGGPVILDLNGSEAAEKWLAENQVQLNAQVYCKDIAVKIALQSISLYTDSDTYVDDMLRSDVWDEHGLVRPSAEWLRLLWTAAHRSFKEIVEASGMSRTQFAAYFYSIPYRTLQNWCNGTSDCPQYWRLLIQEVLGLFTRN